MVSDNLSCYFHISNNSLTYLVTSYFLDQLPFGLRISPLPVAMSSWLICLLLNQLCKEHWSKEPTQSKFMLKKHIHHTCYPFESRMFLCLTDFLIQKGITFWEHLQSISERIDLLLQKLKSKVRINLSPLGLCGADH
jgi:hypothetical protein